MPRTIQEILDSEVANTKMEPIPTSVYWSFGDGRVDLPTPVEFRTSREDHLYDEDAVLIAIDAVRDLMKRNEMRSKLLMDFLIGSKRPVSTRDLCTRFKMRSADAVDILVRLEAQKLVSKQYDNVFGNLWVSKVEREGQQDPLVRFLMNAGEPVRQREILQRFWKRKDELLPRLEELERDGLVEHVQGHRSNIVYWKYRDPTASVAAVHGATIQAAHAESAPITQVVPVPVPTRAVPDPDRIITLIPVSKPSVGEEAEPAAPGEVPISKPRREEQR